MGMLLDFFKRSRESDRRMKEFEMNDRISDKVEEKKKSHAERELIKILESEREETIKETLRCEEKKRMANDKLKARKMMSFNGDMFRNDVILREKNLFLRGGGF